MSADVLLKTVIIIALLIAAAASEWRKWQDSRELPNTEISEEAPENDEPNIIEKYGTTARLVLSLSAEML